MSEHTTVDWHTGDAHLDGVHEEMMHLLAQLAATADVTAVRHALTELIIHTRAHFDLEEGWMHRFNFPAAGCHINEHKQVYGVMVQVLEALDAGQRDYVSVLATELQAWLPIHASTMDYALTHFLSAIHAWESVSENALD